ncbi:ExbD/TolR family protein [Qingshengfaniella alkalisoli]|uniref:ExbD/TolR family protein n=1 Tax=Qingshengfaniella alkalisoli TaxID=2599296 RepID=UPI001F11346D|nr:biopolymer transporter ExbD [Qingshengfaniella alkalisoli]
MFNFSDHRTPRRPSLTPMIDVVFLLLVFFMLAARFGTDMAMPLKLAGSGTGYDGPPRLVDVQAEDVKLNGVVMGEASLLAQLQELTEAPTDTIILRPGKDTPLQRVVDVMQVLNGEGYSSLVMVE